MADFEDFLSELEDSIGDFGSIAMADAMLAAREQETTQ